MLSLSSQKFPKYHTEAESLRCSETTVENYLASCVLEGVYVFQRKKTKPIISSLFSLPMVIFNVSVWKYKMPTIPVNKFFIASCAFIFIFTNSKEKLCLPAESDSYCCMENIILKNNIGVFIPFSSLIFTLPSIWVILYIISTNAK